eukprot:4557527-Amphidinium_carterae.1
MESVTSGTLSTWKVALVRRTPLDELAPGSSVKVAAAGSSDDTSFCAGFYDPGNALFNTRMVCSHSSLRKLASGEFVQAASLNTQSSNTQKCETRLCGFDRLTSTVVHWSRTPLCSRSDLSCSCSNRFAFSQDTGNPKLAWKQSLRKSLFHLRSLSPRMNLDAALFCLEGPEVLFLLEHPPLKWFSCGAQMSKEMASLDHFAGAILSGQYGGYRKGVFLLSSLYAHLEANGVLGKPMPTYGEKSLGFVTKNS